MIRIIHPITAVEIIAEGSSIRELHRLRQQYGPGRWKKKKGIALIETHDDSHHRAEIHWYEAYPTLCTTLPTAEPPGPRPGRFARSRILTV